MTNHTGSFLEWKAAGHSITTPTENTKRTNLFLDNYYLVIGFEVNKPGAFANDTQDLSIDYGHAFFYLVKNLIVANVFSFGPGDLGKVGWLDKGEAVNPNRWDTGAFIKDGRINSRPATADYAIREPVRAFRMALSLPQAQSLQTEIARRRSEIANGKTKYTAVVNDTCAETAKEVLDAAMIATPSGSGFVKHSKISSFPIARCVNPYQWHQDFKAAGYHEVYEPVHAVPYEWHPPVNQVDPIFGCR